ncbi:hypothetical protein [Nocardiopsis suaedae]|uniref:Uncharacterized protein n=1 Tax=Nocardiopsis suaedae TaxID=3018444 RepID=A0ABT4TJL2_9ACTN|nr:hypothetical protein [Nocardiopsis suaedae]MDA2804576.1 hypothetical protein [Nocardiopsis suaedae]
MTDTPARDTGIVHVRLIGTPEAVQRAAEQIEQACTASPPSRPLPSRKNPHHVLVRFEVIA